MYKAIDIAKSVVNRCHQVNKPITHLKLQKILYYVQGESFKRGKQLFEDDFYAWKHGPVIPNVYDQFSRYASFDIPTQRTPISIDEESQRIINNVIDKYIEYPAWELVEKTHQEDPWKYTHQIYGEYSKISPYTIRDYFCK